jgi:hypothetical protein
VAPTTAPSGTIPPATAAPPPVVTPLITVSIPPATTTLITVPPALDSTGHNQGPGAESNGNPDKWAKLRALLTESQYKNLQQLWDAYNRAPDWLKPSIQQAIDIIIQGYGMSLSNLAP